MSNPFRSLDNKKKINGKRSMPFRSFDLSVESSLFESLSLDDDDYIRKVATSRVEKAGSHADRPSVPKDSELMTSMMKRIADLERQALYMTKEIIEKDKRSRVLEEKLDLYKKHQSGEEVKKSAEVARLETKCENYVKQISEMEKFLSDYGLIWVGEDEVQQTDDDDELIDINGGSSEEKFYVIDFDLVIKNIHELNQIAGEGLHLIEKTTDKKARLKLQESIPLVLYANGIMMFNGPFRDMSEPTTQRYLADIADGFFPSELQTKYPDGVPIHVGELLHLFRR